MIEMAQAYKCDRCGTYFDKNVSHEEGGYVVYKTEKNIRNDLCSKERHLCFHCQNALNEFFAKRVFTPAEVDQALVIHGQSDMQFKLNETIKYSPSDVRKILMGEM